MSCTVVSLPVALVWAVGALISSTASALSSLEGSAFDINDDNYQIEDNNCDDVKVITEQHFINKDFETPFTSKDILLKTLEEHGAKNIQESYSGISCEIDNYQLDFTQNVYQEPYKLRITCKEDYNAEEKVDDISQEYALNVQEDTYIHLMEKLKENNMTVESEEVQSDNTIVLTVNID